MAEKKLKVVYKPTADFQIYKIMLYIAERGYPETALKFGERLYEFGKALAYFPDKFPVCSHKNYAKRFLHCAIFDQDYVFIYKTVGSQLVIYTIVHSSRMK